MEGERGWAGRAALRGKVKTPIGVLGQSGQCGAKKAPWRARDAPGAMAIPAASLTLIRSWRGSDDAELEKSDVIVPHEATQSLGGRVQQRVVNSGRGIATAP